MFATLTLLLAQAVVHSAQPKRGLSGLSRASCSDASTLGLQSTWTYNWGIDPDGRDDGRPPCNPPQPCSSCCAFFFHLP